MNVSGPDWVHLNHLKGDLGLTSHLNDGVIEAKRLAQGRTGAAMVHCFHVVNVVSLAGLGTHDLSVAGQCFNQSGFTSSNNHLLNVSHTSLYPQEFQCVLYRFLEACEGCVPVHADLCRSMPVYAGVLWPVLGCAGKACAGLNRFMPLFQGLFWVCGGSARASATPASSTRTGS